VENQPAISLVESWARHLRGCLYLCVVRDVVTGGRLTRRPEKGHSSARARAEKFSGRGERKKYRKIVKKRPNNSTIKPLPGGGGQRKKDRKKKKKTKISTIKPLSTISVSCMKTQGGMVPLPSPCAFLSPG